MMRAPLIITGLGRCGTSMVMQMLDAGGVPCVGQYPAYEEYSPLTITQDDVINAAGKALKVIDPHHAVREQGINFTGCNTIILTRSIEEQAKSQIKFARMLFTGSDGKCFMPPPTRREIRSMKGLLAKENSSVMNIFATNRKIVATFEFILQHPKYFLEKVQQITGPMDIEKAAAQVIKRSPKCYDGLLEIELIERGTLQ